MALTKTDARTVAAQKRIDARNKAEAAARLQAHNDAIRKPQDPEFNVKKGEQVPLHLLNIRQRQINAGIRNENREVAKAVAEAAARSLKLRGNKAATPRVGAKEVYGPNTADKPLLKKRIIPTNATQPTANPANPSGS